MERTRVCITGGEGKLGRCLARRLLGNTGHTVTLLDVSPPAPEEFPADRVLRMQGNVLDPQDLATAFQGCVTVFHLAGLPLAGFAERRPQEAFEVNGWGTELVMEACAKAGVRRVVFASSSQVYGVPSRLPVGEDHTTCPTSVYGASKLAGEAAVRGFTAAGCGASVIARLANLYGFADDADTVVGKALAQVRAGETIALRSLKDVRDLTHVDDVAEALVRLAGHQGDASGCLTVNVSTGVGVSVRTMATTLARLAGQDPATVRGEDPNPGAVPELVLDPSRLSSELGWHPRIGIEEGLARTLQATGISRT
jgi:nucleoside-diphosphate-sugar epimerase